MLLLCQSKGKNLQKLLNSQVAELVDALNIAQIKEC
jgi:hypothetical protein